MTSDELSTRIGQLQNLLNVSFWLGSAEGSRKRN